MFVFRRVFAWEWRSCPSSSWMLTFIRSISGLLTSVLATGHRTASGHPSGSLCVALLSSLTLSLSVCLHLRLSSGSLLYHHHPSGSPGTML
uniref:Putative secreted protein n=1 Tax=Anopheles marajoara TaxID=58244 RepID=A0A2M4CA45_9DIPT